MSWASKGFAVGISGEGGGSGSSGMKVAILTDGGHFPTTRPDSSPLQNGDYVTVSGQSNFPLNIDGKTFYSSKDIGIYQNSDWLIESGTTQDTDETPVSNKALESITGNADFQNKVNKEFVERYKDFFLDTTYEDLDDIAEEDILKRIYKQTTDSHSRKAGYYVYDFINHEWKHFIEQNWEKGTGEKSTQTIGNNNNAIGDSSVAEGAEVDAHAYASHAEGYMTSTGENADYSHAEGYKTTTIGQASHTEGDNTVANNDAEHAEGHYNKSNTGNTDSEKTIHSVGIGNASGSIPGGERKNAFEIMKNGDTYMIGVGGYDGKNPNDSKTIQNVLIQDYLSLKRLGPYTYEASFDDIPEYLENANVNTYVGGCTSFVRDGKTYRSFDLIYNNAAEFLVRTKDFDGIAIIQGIDDGNVKDNKDKLGQLPYHLADGQNRYGIIVTEHVLFNDMHFAGTGTKENDLTKLPTIILQNIKSMSELTTNTVVNNFLDNCKIPDAVSALDYALHFLITDNSTVYTLTPKDDGSAYEFKDITVNPKLVNFKHVNGKIVNREDMDLQERPNGIERWNIIENGATLKDLRFSKCYETPDRLSEFIGEEGTTKASTDEELEAIYELAHQAYLIRTRTDTNPTWQSLHAIVYGKKGIESLCTQENYDINYISQNESDCKKYPYYQLTESNEWHINHNLNGDISNFIVYDDTGRLMGGGDLHIEDANNVTIYFYNAFKGHCILIK